MNMHPEKCRTQSKEYHKQDLQISLTIVTTKAWRRAYKLKQMNMHPEKCRTQSKQYHKQDLQISLTIVSTKAWRRAYKLKSILFNNMVQTSSNILI